MNRFATLAVASFASIMLVGFAEAAPAPVAQIAGVSGEPLTLTSAKQIVNKTLADSGQRNMRAGQAQFTADGNVAVEVVSLQGLPVSHVVVHADNGMVTAAGPAKGAKG